MIKALRKFVGPVYENSLMGVILLTIIFFSALVVCFLAPDKSIFAFLYAIIFSALREQHLQKYIEENYEKKKQ